MKGRFQIKSAHTNDIICMVDFRSDSLEKIIEYYQGETLLHNKSLIVYDHEDDIFVDIDELMEAWDEGESPGDLQMF